MRYRDFAPTGFDRRGLALADRQDWIVSAIQRNRDSGNLSMSNWDAAISVLGDTEGHEVHRFGHWACGWFEVILYSPGSPSAELIEEMESCLADYPVLDDADLSEREYDELISYLSDECRYIAESSETHKELGVWCTLSDDFCADAVAERLGVYRVEECGTRDKILWALSDLGFLQEDGE